MLYFSMFCVSAGSKSNLAKAAGAEVAFRLGNEKLHAAVARSAFSSQNRKKTDGLGPLFEVAMWKNCTPLWREAHFEVKMLKNWHSQTTFWSCDEKLHAAVAGSTFWSQNAKKMTLSGHFLTCRCRAIVEKWHAAVAPSAFTSQNVQNTCVLRHFWRFHCAISSTH